jgi:uncharacterized protein (DUF58 family)
MTSGAGMGGAAETLGLTPDILRALERLTLPSRRAVLGSGAGQRRSRRYGSSLDLADYRAYAAGDDIRRLDWGAYARLERLFTRLYAGEEDSCVTFWVDMSASMQWDRPNKAAKACAIAGGLGFVSLAAEDRVACVAFSDAVIARAGPFRGKRSAPRLWAALTALLSTGGGGPRTHWACLAAAARSVPAGLAVVISDFLSPPASVRPAVSALRMAGSEVLMLQVLSPEELRPSMQGELRLVDSESAGTVEVTMGRAALLAYNEQRSGHAHALRTLASAHDARFVSVDGGSQLRRLLLSDLVRARALN